jgi:hypothetical protein
MRASVGSAMWAWVEVMVDSMTGLEKRRSASAGRALRGGAEAACARSEGAAAKARVEWRKLRRFIGMSVEQGSGWAAGREFVKGGRVWRRTMLRMKNFAKEGGNTF